MKIYLGADHRGYKLKEKMYRWLADMGEYVVEDFGAYEYDKADDYTLFAEKVASVVAKSEKDRGILFCGSGVGVGIVANKFDGVRASFGKEYKQVQAGRRDDDMNVLVIAADFTSESEARKMIRSFLETKFDGKARHEKRLEDIRRLEENN